MGCNIHESISWYQKKIGTYDKQPWEKTVEQRILSGLTHVPMKSAKLKTELIDLDLVRGSAFTKAKPKHGLLTVTRLATVRLLFLPFYYQWWIFQTSVRIFLILLFLYTLQLFNTFVYFSSWFPYDSANTLECLSHSAKYTIDVPIGKSEGKITWLDELVHKNIPASEVLLPFGMMLILSLIHSQIVSTHSTSSHNKKQEMLKDDYTRRVKRTRRRNPSIVKSRQSHNDAKQATESSCNGSSPTDGKFNKRTRVKIDDSSRKHRRSVVWDTTPTKGKAISSNFKTLDDNRKETSDTKTHPGQELDKSVNDAKEIDRIECVQIPAESPSTTPLDDDGFESLDGNGSCDSNKEDRDISLTAAEYVTAVKHSPAHVAAERMLNRPADDVTKGAIDAALFGPQNKNDDDVETDKEDTDCENSESETTSERSFKNKLLLSRRRGSQQNLTVTMKNLAESSFNSSGDESEDGATLSSPGSFCPLMTEGTTSAGEWIGITTNSEECSYSSEIDGSDNQISLTSDINDHPFAWEMEAMPNVLFSPSCAPVGKVSCTMWEKKEVKKANLSVLDISSAIIGRVELMPENMDYFYIGLVMSFLLSALPSICRLTASLYDANTMRTGSLTSHLVRNAILVDSYCPLNGSPSSMLTTTLTILRTTFGNTPREQIVIFISLLERFCLSAIFFFLLTVSERTFKQRFLYAKFFTHLTSFRRARKSELPHFRLNKVRNIKSWLSVRSYLKKRGPQRSVDVIVSTAFLLMVIILSFLSFELLKDSEYNAEAVGWCVVIGFYMLRFMTLGTKINRKYRNLSTIITEQINLYLQIEQKPNKKDELMVANSVLKLAADLLKELESPFKISGLSANPYLYTVTKVVMLSALSGILSEVLGFKLKLHKIKIK